MGPESLSVGPPVHPSVCLCVHIFKHKYLETGRRIASTFLYFVFKRGGKIAICFGAAQLRTLVYMATHSCHRIIKV